MEHSRSLKPGTVTLDPTEAEELVRALVSRGPITGIVVISSETAGGIGIATSVTVNGEKINITNYDHW